MNWVQAYAVSTKRVGTMIRIRIICLAIELKIEVICGHCLSVAAKLSCQAKKWTTDTHLYYFKTS